MAKLGHKGWMAAGMAVIAVALIPFSAAARQDSPEGVVRAYYATLLEVMRNAKTLGYDGRYKKLEPAVAATFNIRFIARVSLHRAYWRGLNDSQKAKYVATYNRLSVATYAARFAGFSGEKLEVLGVRETRRKDALVRTRIVKSNGEPVPIHYLLRKRKGEWRVIDVFLNGTISEVATRRSDFSAIMRDQGFDALIAAIDGKVKKLRAE